MTREEIAKNENLKIGIYTIGISNITGLSFIYGFRNKKHLEEIKERYKLNTHVFYKRPNSSLWYRDSRGFINIPIDSLEYVECYYKKDLQKFFDIEIKFMLELINSSIDEDKFLEILNEKMFMFKTLKSFENDKDYIIVSDGKFVRTILEDSIQDVFFDGTEILIGLATY